MFRLNSDILVFMLHNCRRKLFRLIAGDDRAFLDVRPGRDLYVPSIRNLICKLISFGADGDDIFNMRRTRHRSSKLFVIMAGNHRASLDVLSIINSNVPAVWNLMFLAENFAVDDRGDANAVLADGQAQDAAYISHHRFAFGFLPRLKQFFDPRQTTGNIASRLGRPSSVKSPQG